MSKHKLVIGGVIITWFIIASIAIFWLSTASKSDFDPNMTLSQAIMSLSFEQDLASALSQTQQISLSANSPTIFHLTQGRCYCEFLAKSHQSSLKNWSSAEGFENVELDVNAFPQIKRFVPSTPAVVVLDADKNLLYLGPYSRGSGCFANSGEVDIYLQEWVETKDNLTKQSTALIDTDASGCYCNT